MDTGHWGQTVGGRRTRNQAIISRANNILTILFPRFCRGAVTASVVDDVYSLHLRTHQLHRFFAMFTAVKGNYVRFHS